MWTCLKCGRIFKRTDQPHSCHKIILEQHFKNKEHAKKLFNFLVNLINEKIGKCKIISLPCCVHLFGHYDFLAALPKKDRLEIRFTLNRILKNSRLKQSVPISSKSFKNCIDITNENEIDGELLNWLIEAYHLKDK
jgi:hypothetical protein